jgi:hypothetical protein
MRQLLLAASSSTARTAQSVLGSVVEFWQPSLAVGSGDISRWERRGRLLVLVVLVAGLIVAVNRAILHGCSDFFWFREAGRYVLEHGTRDPESNLARYWPSNDVIWVAFACLPLPLGAGIWYLVGCWSWIGLLDSIRRELLVDGDEVLRRQATLLAGLLTLPLALDGLCLGSFHIFMVWLMMAGLLRASRGKDWSGGLLLGAAAWLKLLPLLGVGYLVLKRRWKPALVATACAVTMDVVLSVVAFGPSAAWDAHVEWWNQGATGTAMRQLTSPVSVDEDRLTNQSVPVTLRRLLSSLGTLPGTARERVQVADLSADQLEMVYTAVMSLLALGIAVYCRRPGRATSPGRWSVEIALVILATVWFSPVMWSYHLTAVAPALAIVLCRLEKQHALAVVVAAVWLAALALLVWPVARAAGDMLWLSLLSGGLLVWITGNRDWGLGIREPGTA